MTILLLFVFAALPTSLAFPICESYLHRRDSLRLDQRFQSYVHFASTVTFDSGEPTLEEALLDVQRRVEAASLARVNDFPEMKTSKLVAVSKTKPVEQLMDVYKAGQRCFGENYVQELLDKAPQMPPDVQWHFIGHIQSNKAKQLIQGVPNLVVVETLDSLKLARKLNLALEANDPSGKRRLTVFLQVDTSGEDSKSGVTIEEAPDLAMAICAECPRLFLDGLMTIGAQGDSSCFARLVECRVAVASALSREPATFELSMGMSADYEEAILNGASSVRVGSSIFGARDYSRRAS